MISTARRNTRNSIAPKDDSSWKIMLIRRWRDPGVKVLASSVIQLENLSGDDKAEPTTIDLGWMHSPLVYSAAALSNDMPLHSQEENRWQVGFPARNGGDINGSQLKFVLRVSPDSPTGIANPLLSVDRRDYIMLPVTLHPGQYMAAPVNAPVVFIYNAKHEVIGEVYPRHRNDLPNVGSRTDFTVTCQFDAQDCSKEPVAFLNVMHSEVITASKKKH